MGRSAEKEKLTVVVIDNDPTYIRLWTRVCSNIGDCHLYCFEDSDTALSFIKTQKVDMVITEAVLSKNDGYKIAEEAHKINPESEVIITSAYDCDLSRFNLKNPHFSILYKPYSNINDIQTFVSHLLHKEDVYGDVSEDSFSENESFPEIMEWKL